MISAQKIPAYLSPDDYLLIEERAMTKHEYLDGVIYDWQRGVPKAMAGGSKDHNRVSANIYIALRAQLKGAPCEAFVADVRVSARDDFASFYPDVVVTCSSDDRTSAQGIREPKLVVEVLSPSTELFDRGEKFRVYRSFASLQAYVLVSPERRSVEVFSRDNGWADPQHSERRLAGPELLALGTLDLQLLAADVFEGV